MINFLKNNWEYLIFIVIVIFITLKSITNKVKLDNIMNLKQNDILMDDVNNSRKKKEVDINNVKIKVTTNKMKNLDVTGIYNSTKEFFNEGLVFKNEKKNLWIFRYNDVVSENEENLYWVLSSQEPKVYQESNEKITYYSSINIVELDSYYIYQFVDYGNLIDKAIMYDVTDSNFTIEINQLD